MQNIKIGHYSDHDNKTGVTVFIPDQAMRCNYHICGSAPASSELTVMDSEHVVEKIDALMFTGGSAFGLPAVAGVMQWLKEQGRGFPTASIPVPIVPAAAIYDLSVGEPTAPTPKQAYQACEAANQEMATGSLGAGVGATVGKLIPGSTPGQGGFSVATLSQGKLDVMAAVVVNASGNIIDGNGQVVIGGESIVNHVLQGGQLSSDLKGQNTTLVAVFTNVDLNSAALKRIAKMAASGMARAINPVFTPYDGDIVFAASIGDIKAPELEVGVLAVEAVQRAILGA